MTAGSLLLALVEWSLRAAILAGAAAALLFAFRMKDVHVRLTVWTTVLAAVLLMPAAGRLLPPLPLPLPVPGLVTAAEPGAAVESAVSLTPATADEAAPLPAPQPAAALMQPQTTTQHPRSRAAIAAGLWFAGACFLLARLATGLWLSRQLARTSVFVQDGVRESPRVRVPITVGLIRPAVVLPADWRTWSGGKLRAVLEHERSHAQRLDPLRHFLASLYCSVCWFHPLAWWLKAHLTGLAEAASDDVALAACDDRAEYAKTLLAFFGAAHRRVRYHGIAMANPRTRAYRMGRVLDADRPLTRPLRLPVAAALVAGALGMAFVTTAARPVQAAARIAPPAPVAAPSPAPARQPAPSPASQPAPVPTATAPTAATATQAVPVPAAPAPTPAPAPQPALQPARAPQPAAALVAQAVPAPVPSAQSPAPSPAPAPHPSSQGGTTTAVRAGTPVEHCGGAPMYAKWLDHDVRYIATNSERRDFLALRTQPACEVFIETFWRRRDPSPGTPENEFKEEHYRRLAYVNERFASTVPGWQTDRGRTYILYGPPDAIESHPSGGFEEGGTTKRLDPFEQWYYRYIDGLGEDAVFDFVDRGGRGNYRLSGSAAVRVRADHESGTVQSVAFGPAQGLSVRVYPGRAPLMALPVIPSGRELTVYGRLTNYNRRVVYVFEDKAAGDAGVYTKWLNGSLAPGSYRLRAAAKGTRANGEPAVDLHDLTFEVK